MKWLGALPQRTSELFGADLSLAQRTCQCADLQFWMERNYATDRAAPQNDMASTLTHIDEPQPLQRTNRLRSGDARQLRHAPEP